MENITSFKDLKLIPPLERALTKQGYTIPTPIQLKSIPSLLLGKDLIGIAQTGENDTAGLAPVDTGIDRYIDNIAFGVDEKLEFIFPSTDGYTALTRQLDLFEEELSKKNNPFEISSIEYQTTEELENYSVLPLRMSIESSADNFTKFLHQIENSGSLDDQVRLMDIQSIRLNFSDNEDESKLIKFTVQINAYFQK